MSTFVIGDIHGRAPAFDDVLEKAAFNNEKDTLIVLGDIVDGYPWTKDCIDKLLTIKNLIPIRGNHDYPWFYNWCNTGEELPIWVHQGGYATMRSYDFDYKSVPEEHIKLIESARVYYIDEKNNIYCHGGFNPKVPIEKQTAEFIMWDRTLCQYAHDMFINKINVNIKPYNRVFLGHTSTGFYDKRKYVPQIYGNVIMLDTGAGDMGKLSIMNVDTLEYYQSNKTGGFLWRRTY